MKLDFDPAAPINSRIGMPLHWRSPGYHDAPDQTQRVIGRHVYIFQTTTIGITVWRSDLADEDGGYRWTRVHTFAAEAGESA